MKEILSKMNLKEKEYYIMKMVKKNTKVNLLMVYLMEMENYFMKMKILNMMAIFQKVKKVVKEYYIMKMVK